MRFSICILFLVISVTLLEALPRPQENSTKRQPWKPKAIREKEAAEAVMQAAREAEEAARALEEAARAVEEVTEIVEETTEIVEEVTEAAKQNEKVTDETTEIVEQTTSMKEEASEIMEQVSVVPIESTTLITTTTTLPVDEDVPVENVKLVEEVVIKDEALATPMPASTTTKSDLLTDSVSKKQANILFTGRKLSKLKFSSNEKASSLTKKGAEIAEGDCRLSLRGIPCQCRFEGTCRCDCGRRSATNQSVQTAIRLRPTRIPGRISQWLNQPEQL